MNWGRTVAAAIVLVVLSFVSTFAQATASMSVEMSLSGPLTKVTVARAWPSRPPLPVVHGSIMQAGDG